MATIKQLELAEVLHPIKGKLPGRLLPSRRLYGTTGFLKWATKDLPKIPETHWGGQVPARDQAASIIRDFIAGEKLSFTEQLNYLDPSGNGVWELKTGDVRLFGWFYDIDFMILSTGADANYLKRKSKERYGRCVRMVQNEIDAIELNNPKFITSTDLRDVISD